MYLLSVYIVFRLAEMEAKLRVVIDEDRIEKLVLPSGIPSTVEELQTALKDNFELSYDFKISYLDSDFDQFFSLRRINQIKHLDTIKLEYQAPPTVLTLFPLDEHLNNLLSQPSTDCDYSDCSEPSASAVFVFVFFFVFVFLIFYASLKDQITGPVSYLHDIFW